MMKYIQIDSLIIGTILGALSLYYAPEFLLFPWSALCWMLGGLLFVFVLYVVFQKKLIARLCFNALLFIMACGYMQNRALDLLTEAKAVASLPSKIQATFKIEEIHHQYDYQAAVIEVDLSPTLMKQRLYARLSFEEKVKIGEIWQGELRIRAISSRLNQGGFDRQQWYFAKAITGYATIKSAVKIGNDFSWRDKLFYRAKQQTENLPQQGLLLALAFGERAWLPAEHWKTYQQTNTAHLIAISGLHIGLAALIGFYLARGIQFFLPNRFISPYFPLLFSGLFALFYAQLAGLAIPTFRAVVALLVLIAFRSYRYYFTPWRLFFLVISLLLLFDPIMILSGSFILSVGAVGSLILWYQLFPLSDFPWHEKTWFKRLKWAAGLVHLQIGLFWLFMPLQLAIFGGFSQYGLIANLIAVPLFSFILVPLVLLAILTQGSVGSWQVADRLAEQILLMLSWFEQGWIAVSDKTQWILTALLTLLLLWRLWALDGEKGGKKISPKMGLLFGALICYSLGNWAVKQFTTEEWQIETLDVGQGLATLIVKNHRGILYDTGAGWQNGSMAELEILPYLRREGIVLDKLILSHDDNDHAGGTNQILSAFPKVEFMPASNKNYGKIDRTFCQKGADFQWQGLFFQILSPQQVKDEAENADSCVIHVSDGRYHLLLTGDADIGTERQISPLLQKMNILQVGHHGSKTSTGQILLNKIQPEIALISSGRWNPWRFPHKTVVERLEAAQSAVYNTAVSGQISVLVNREGIHIETARHRWSPWYRQLIIP